MKKERIIFSDLENGDDFNYGTTVGVRPAIWVANRFVG